MNLKERMEKFNKRWDVTSDDSYQESFSKFKIRILNIFKDIDGRVARASISSFCQYYGIKEVWRSQPFGDRSWSTNIIDRLDGESGEKEFYRLIEIIFSLDITTTSNYDGRPLYSKNTLFNEVVEAINFSDVNVSIVSKDDEIILYPKGEQMLDEELVNLPISFLSEGSGNHFVQSLQLYQEKKYIKSAESLRRSLEEFLRYKLKNTKGLDANILELQARLKSDGRDVQIRNIVGSIFSYLDKYFNENSKHNDGEINDPENEFLIYQAGLLLRYINSNI
jgi:virulence-associated protein VagC